jgi:hypothetical protein
MRIRLDAVSAYHVDQTAKRENRNATDACRVLIAEGVAARRGQSATPPAPAELAEGWDSAVAHGRTIALHAPHSLVCAVERLAARESRSISSTLKNLLREALRQRGELPVVGNDPVGSRRDESSPS